MNATPRSHFEEIDWLDYVQGETEGRFREDLAAHLAVCAECGLTVKSLGRLARSLPVALTLVRDSGEVADPVAANEAVIAAALAEDRWRADGAEGREEAILAVFAKDCPSPFPFRWTAPLLEAAHPLCRALLRTDLAKAGRILRSALAPAEASLVHGVSGLEACLRASFAYVRMYEGAVEESLRILDEVRPVLEADLPVPEIELAYWHYVRAAALRNLSRSEDALLEIRASRALYEVLEDPDRLARCRQVEAILVSELGNPDSSIAIYRELIAETSPGRDAQLHAQLLTNYGADLARAGRSKEARAIYARALDLLEKTGLGEQAFRIRAGLARIAEQEGKREEALAMKIAMRADVRLIAIPWEEIIHELEIARLYLELGREAQAAEICRALLPRAQELGFEKETANALAYLEEAEREIDLARLDRVVRFARRRQAGEDIRWSAA
jgi:tetratricopeptide (TPR) repeat protein